jgi:alanine racemase
LPRTAWLAIDLDALAANLEIIRALAGTDARVEPVVKADAYGHGLVPIARALAEAGADGLCVAAFDEAIAIREAGVDLRLTVLYPIPAAFATDAARRGIAVAAGDPDLLRELLAALAGAAGTLAAAEGGPLEIELEIETGLGRGGVSVERAVEAARAIEASPNVRLAGVWSHLQAPENARRSATQVARFESAVGDLARAGIEVPRRHLAASGGLLDGGAPAYEAVRPGLAIYGIVPDELDPTTLPAAATRLRPVLSLLARPVRVIELPAGHGISYGPSFETGRQSRIATLPLGYGDGWPRALSNRAEAIVRGRRVPIVGNVAMDAVMVDVTDVPGPPVGPRDVFVLLGEQESERITAGELARARTTNSWEVVTAMSGRLPRVYHASAGVVGVRTLIPGENTWLGSNSGTGTSATSRSTRS